MIEKCYNFESNFSTMAIFQYTEKTITETLTGEDKGNEQFLILHDDDVHTFDYVIDSLIDVCKVEIEQAEQITYIVHYKGKCDVKKGSKEILLPMRRQLAKRGLKATID